MKTVIFAPIDSDGVRACIKASGFVRWGPGLWIRDGRLTEEERKMLYRRLADGHAIFVLRSAVDVIRGGI